MSDETWSNELERVLVGLSDEAEAIRTMSSTGDAQRTRYVALFESVVDATERLAPLLGDRWCVSLYAGWVVMPLLDSSLEWLHLGTRHVDEVDRRFVDALHRYVAVTAVDPYCDVVKRAHQLLSHLIVEHPGIEAPAAQRRPWNSTFVPRPSTRRPNVLRVATWNLKQAVAPRASVDEQWRWVGSHLGADVVVFTEARMPPDGVPAGWSALHHPGGLGPRRTWGTIVAAHGLQVEPVHSVVVDGSVVPLRTSSPGAVVIADILHDGVRLVTIVGVYCETIDAEGERCGHGRHTTKRLVRELTPLFRSDRRDSIIIAGDFNVWPEDAPRLRVYGIHDLTTRSRTRREWSTACAQCAPEPTCHHLWTHKNAGGPNAAIQQIDFLYASRALFADHDEVIGGYEDFPDADLMSDHAPLMATLTLPPPA